MLPIPALVGLIVLLHPEPYEVAGVKLRVSAAPEKPAFLLGEPGFVAFKLNNLSDCEAGVWFGGDYRNRLGRPNTFKIDVRDADGNPVAQPDPGFDMGGMTGVQKLPAKGQYVAPLFLPHWAEFTKPGRYTVTIRRPLQAQDQAGADGVRFRPPPVEVLAVTTVTILPSDFAKLGKLIDGWGRAMLDPKAADEERARQMLVATDDERVVPHFVRLSKRSWPYDKSTACRVLGRFKSDEALAALKRLAATTGEDVRGSSTTAELDESSAQSVRHSAVAAIAKSPHPDAVGLLWGFAADPYYGVRVTVLHRAFELKTPEARAVIKAMTGDANKVVADEARRYEGLLPPE